MAARIPFDRLALASVLWLLLPFACGLRLWWFTANQAIWPDEAAYMLIAKTFAGLSDYEAPAVRPVLLPLLWSGLYRLGFGESATRVTAMLLSVASVWLLYALGRELYGKSVAAIAALLLCVSPPHLFFSQRLLTDLPALATWLGTLVIASRIVATPGSRAAVLLLGPAVAAMLLLAS